MKLDLNKTNGSSPPEDSDVITQLYKEHDPLVRSIIRNHLKSHYSTFPLNSAESDDLSQEVWLKVTKNFRSYQNRGYKITAWIGKVVKNHMLDWCAKGRNRHRLGPTVALDGHPSPDKDRRVSDSKLPARSKPRAKNPDQIVDPGTRYGNFDPFFGTSGAY